MACQKHKAMAGFKSNVLFTVWAHGQTCSNQRPWATFVMHGFGWGLGLTVRVRPGGRGFHKLFWRSVWFLNGRLCSSVVPAVWSSKYSTNAPLMRLEAKHWKADFFFFSLSERCCNYCDTKSWQPATVGVTLGSRGRRDKRDNNFFSPSAGTTCGRIGCFKKKKKKNLSCNGVRLWTETAA